MCFYKGEQHVKKIIFVFFLVLSVLFFKLNDTASAWIKHVFVYKIHKEKIVKNFSSAYKSEKALVEPYFDAVFYANKYKKQLEETGLCPIDHFMIYGWTGGDNWKSHCDPNDWFNITLYKYRIWPCKGNPFIDFLKQPVNMPPLDAQTVHIYAKKDELQRAWYAVEALLRKQKFHVTLHLHKNSFDTTPLAFKPHEKRGLQVIFYEGAEKSFYECDFLKQKPEFVEPEGVKDLPYKPLYLRNGPAGNFYIQHLLYCFTGWWTFGLVDPCAINIGAFHTEPVSSFYHVVTEENFKEFMARIAPAFDLLLVGIPVDVKHSKVIPGYMATWVEDADIPGTKDFSVSFLLSIGGKDLSRADELTAEGMLYKDRLNLWDRRHEITMLKKFYVSRRDIKVFPEKYKDFAMPTQSKACLFGSQFSIAIENTRQHNYFTEKLLGCFYTLTVPIYIGCPNITDYFNPKGMLIAKNIDEAIAICNSLTPETYAEMLPYLQENRQKTLELLKLEEQRIQDFFKEKFGSEPFQVTTFFS